MKLNKSILCLVFLAVLVLGSCSQARYGSHTLRVKSNDVVQKTTTDQRAKKATAQLDVQQVEEIATSKIKQTAEVLVSQKFIDQESIVGKPQKNNIANTGKQTNLNTAKKQNKAVKKVEKLLKYSKAKAKVQHAKENITSSITQADDEVGDILYIILIVLLVLLIINLITSLIPALSWLLGIVLLVLLIYLLLQML